MLAAFLPKTKQWRIDAENTNLQLELTMHFKTRTPTSDE